MDEILIEEKRYVSSKRAAKMTGYAKDYIGQLCREGRVPARLVGRSWYVLESAIQDHRFGDTDPATPAPRLSTSTWEAPRYEAFSEEFIPVLHRPQDAETPTPMNADSRDKEHKPEFTQHLQDSWRAWFDRVEDAKPATLIATETEKGPVEPEISEKKEEKEGNITIRTIYQ